jgi:putative acetyltransferase
MNLTVRQETTTDHAEVYDLNKAAFEQDTEAKLVEALRKSEAFIPELSIVAVLEGKIVGHILFTRIKIRDDMGNTYDSLALAPIAVTPVLQKQGIGGQMIRSGLAKAREFVYQLVIVLGHENYYPKFGFVPGGEVEYKSAL